MTDADDVESLIEKAAELSSSSQEELLYRLAEMHAQDLGMDDREDEELTAHKID